MNFFEHQDVTRRNTKFLVFLFCLAVVLIILFVHTAASLGIFYAHQSGFTIIDTFPRHTHVGFQQFLLEPKIILWSVFGTLGVILLGSAYMMHRLSKGGSAVAELLGGVVILPGTTEPHERKLLNVVEEMAIASGVPMPKVYLIYEEEGINAFAAGFSPSDAAIGVTKGCIQLLTRDELQGVIAHEFSHILNGDMRLNIRLTGVLHGILCIALIGYWTLRFSSGGRSYRSRKGGNGLFLVAALALLVIGYIGVFFGKLIKSAVSRQREYLADASAVQFTRLPDGIAGALKKIGGFSAESRVRHPNAETVSHMFFGNPFKKSFFKGLSTHPPLLDRIKRIEPGFKGSFPKTKGIPLETTNVRPETMGLTGETMKKISATDISSLVGNPSTKHLLYAGTFLRNLPSQLAQSAHEPFGARAIVYGLLIGGDEKAQAAQWSCLESQADPLVFRETKKFAPAIQKLGEKARLPLIDLALPALRTLSPQQYNRFTKIVMKLMKADGQMDIFEFVLIKVLTRHLTPHFAKTNKKKTKFRTLGSVYPDIQKLLSAVAYAGTPNDLEAERAFQKGMRRLGLQNAEIILSKDFRVTDLNRVLDRLAHASPSLKKEILEATVETIAADKEVNTQEAELLRAVGDSIDCPIPPILI